LSLERLVAKTLPRTAVTRIWSEHLTETIPPPTRRSLENIKDPLFVRTPLIHERVIYPYGFPVSLASNSPLVLQAADISWGTYQNLFMTPPLDVRCLVGDSDSPACVEPPVFRSQSHLLSIVVDNENFACLDLERAFSFGWVSRKTAESTEYFRQCILDVMIYPLLEIKYLITLHAACVLFNGRGVLLTGDSGAGKSSLAYACAKRGWTFVSDDASAFFRDARTPEVIGHPHRFRFREPVGELFPEFQGLRSTLRAYGKPTIEVRTTGLPIETASSGPIDFVVFLNRRDFTSGPPQVVRLDSEDAWGRLLSSVWDVQLPALDKRVEALGRLLTKPIYEIRYGPLDEAIDALEQLVRESE
jgi:hypothetical protein